MWCALGLGRTTGLFASGDGKTGQENVERPPKFAGTGEDAGDMVGLTGFDRVTAVERQLLFGGVVFDLWHKECTPSPGCETDNRHSGPSGPLEMEFIPYGLKGQATVRRCVLVDKVGKLFATSQGLVQFLTALAQVHQIIGFKHRT